MQKEAIRAKRGAYQAYDDEEFEGDIGPGAKRKVGRQHVGVFMDITNISLTVPFLSTCTLKCHGCGETLQRGVDGSISPVMVWPVL